MRRHMHSAASRRRVLGLGAGFAASAWLPALANAQTGASALIARPIPHSGESLPVVGLGTSQVFEVGDDPARRQACTEVVKTLVAGGGKLIDTAPSYGNAESVVGDLLAATELRGRVFLATKLEDYDRNTGAAQLRASLQRLRTDRVDLIQLHNVGDPHQDLAMLREWKSQGFCRYIGITTSFDGIEVTAEGGGDADIPAKTLRLPFTQHRQILVWITDIVELY